MPWPAARRNCACLVLSFVGWCPTSTLAQDTQPAERKVRYFLEVAATSTTDLPAHVGVTIVLPPLAAGPRVFIVPRAVPMGYSVQPYDRFVSNVRAFNEAKSPLPASRTDGPRWTIGSERAVVARIEYQVDVPAMERAILSLGDTSRVRPGYAFLLGYSMFGYVEGLENLPIELSVSGPGRSAKHATLDINGISTWHIDAKARDFYALADSQIVVGNVRHAASEIQARESGGASLQLVTLAYAEGELDFDRLRREVRETYVKVENYFGTRPFSKYTTIAEFLQLPTPQHRAGFSMEHLQSATFCLEVSAIPRTEQDWARTRYNLAHHIAHAWIPKRASGEGYFPFQWELPTLFDSIWFSEGFGQYAAADALADAIPEADRQAYLDRIVELRFRGTLREMPAFLTQMPLVELSRIASTQYSEDFRTGRTVFSRGGLMAYEMDMAIRKATGGKKRLRDALRGLMAWSARERRGFRIEELPKIFEEATGVDTRPILEKWLKPMPASAIAVPR